MRVSWQWLADYVDLPRSEDAKRELRARLEMAGLAIDSVDRPGQGAQGIWAGRILSVEAHPDASALWIVELDLGPRGACTVVSGADNFSPGDVVPVVLPGGALPGGRGIDRSTIRGVVSEGMMCSAAELGLGEGEEAAAGIMLLGAGIEPGTDCIELLGLDDEVLELDLTPNYAVFCQSMLGVAREVAGITGAEVRMPAAATGAEPADDGLCGPLSAAQARSLATGRAAGLASVRIQAPQLCGRYSGALFGDVRIEPSPWWMQRRLLAAGQRPINNIVDVTNYVMLELGQPLHAFDFDRVRGGEVLIRAAGDGEMLRTLDGVDRQLPSGSLVIADPGGPIAIAGIMGGEETEIGDSTTRVFLESANFQRTSVRRTSRALGLRTEASMRFEKGIDPAVTVLAIERVSQLWAELGAARRIDGVLDEVARPVGPREITATADYLRTVTGMDLPAATMVDLLSRLGISAEVVAVPDDGREALRAVVPTRRLDVEGQADLAEEIARMYGYDRLEARLPVGRTPSAALPPRRRVSLAARAAMLGGGLDELVTFAYHAPGEFDRLLIPPDHPWRKAIPLLNPMSEEQGVMRTSLVPNLLRVASLNAGHGVDEMHGFEIGRVYSPAELPLRELPAEPLRCAIILSGATPGTANWRVKEREADFFVLKGYVESLLSVMRVRGAQYTAVEVPYLHPGRAASVVVAGRVVGWLGELHPQVATEYDLRGRLCLAELDMEALIELASPPALFGGLPRYPALERDMAFLVPQDIPAAAVEEVIRQHGGELLEQVRLFDVYEGAQVQAGYRSLAYSLRLRSAQRTLTDEEADHTTQGIAAQLTGMGIQLRG